VLGVLLFLLIPLHAAFAKGGTVVRLEPEALTLQPGETGEVIVRIEGVTDLAGAEVHLEYDADLLEVVDADPGTEGVQIGHGGFLAADFVVQNQVDLQAGRIDYAVAQMPPHEPVSGGGPLATVVLRARGEGEGAVVLQTVLLADSSGNAIPTEVAVDRVAVVVGSPTARSCPPAGALFLSALGLGLIVRSKRVGSDGRPTLVQVDEAE
jgi:hypothetical protein